VSIAVGLEVSWIEQPSGVVDGNNGYDFSVRSIDNPVTSLK